MTEIIISKSKNPDKKYDARIDGKKTVSFGSAQHSDFTKHITAKLNLISNLNEK